MKCRFIRNFLFLLVLIMLSSMVVAMEATNSTCGEVSSDLVLVTNVTSSGTCFSINSSDITLDCDDNYVFYSMGSQGNGIEVNGFDNVTIIDCDIIQVNSSYSSSHGLYLNNSDNNSLSELHSNTRGNNSHSVYLDGTSNLNILSNLFLVANGSNSFEILDETDSNVSNFLTFINNFGEINWTNTSFLANLTLSGIIGPESNLQLIENTAYLNTPAFVGGINSSAQITFYNLSNFTSPTVYIDGEVCGDCSNVTDLGGGNYTFNVSHWTSYTLDNEHGFYNDNFVFCHDFEGDQASCEADSNCVWFANGDEGNEWCQDPAGCCDHVSCELFDGDNAACLASNLGCAWKDNSNNGESFCHINNDNYDWFGIVDSVDIGCCEAPACWDSDGLGESTCTNSGNCVWDSGNSECNEAGCFDVETEMDCNMIGMHMGCIWDGNSCSPDAGAFDFDDCWANQGFWDGDGCVEQNYGSGLWDFADDVNCWAYDFDSNSCGFIDGCIYCDSDNILDATSFCFNKQEDWCEGHHIDAATACSGGQCGDAESDSMACEDILDGTICDCGVLPGCAWDGSTCVSGTSNCNINYDGIEIGGEDYQTCDDAEDNEADCDSLKQDYLLPCAFIDGECQFDWQNGGGFGDEKGGEGGFDFDDIEVVSDNDPNCIFAGGSPKCVEIDGNGNLDCWCEFSFGQGVGDCEDSCWACEFQSDGSDWVSEAAFQVACEGSAAAGGNCEFVSDDYAPNGYGWCDFPHEMMGGGYGGNCDSNCFDCFEENMCDSSSETCTWFTDPFNGEDFCVPEELANFKDVDQNCMVAHTEVICLASAVVGGCEWTVGYGSDPVTGDAYDLCHENTTTPEVCWDGADNDADSDVDCDDSDCSDDISCGNGYGDEDFFMMDNLLAAEVCYSQDGTSAAQCEANILADASAYNAGTGERGVLTLPLHLAGEKLCYWSTDFEGNGLCDPSFQAEMGGDMDFNAPPVIIAFDDDDVDKDYLDLREIGFKEDGTEKLAIGVAVTDLRDFAACNYDIGGSAIEEGSFVTYLDIDADLETGCDTSSEEGFEYKIFFNAQMDGSDPIINTKVYQCVDSDTDQWVIAPIFVVSVEGGCMVDGEGDIIGINAQLINKADFGISGDMRLYGVSLDGTDEDVVYDTIGPEYYTPGSIDVQVEECFDFIDNDGDNLADAADPDCQFVYQLGYQPMEYDCGDGEDNDGDGDVDGDDYDCENHPLVAGIDDAFNFEVDLNDITAPSFLFTEIFETHDSIWIHFDTNEPTQGEVLVYTDASCSEIDSTFTDTGFECGAEAWCDNVGTQDDYKSFHDIEVTDLDADTTYYLRYSAVDVSDNSVYSDCKEVTTDAEEASFYVDAEIPVGGFEVEFGGNDLTDFAQEFTIDDATAQDLEISCPDAGYTITFVNANILSADTLDLTNLVCDANDDFLGMESEAWNELLDALSPDYVRLEFAIDGVGDDHDIEIDHCDEDGDNCAEGWEDIIDYQIEDDLVTLYISTGTGFSTYKVTTTAPSSDSSESSSGGSSGGGGGGGGGAATAKTYVVNEVQFVEGYTKEALAVGNRLRFVIDEENHYITLDDVTPTSVEITVESEPQEATLTLNEVAKFELDGDNYYDLQITLLGINSSGENADLNVVSIHESMPVVETTVEEIVVEEPIEETVEKQLEESIDSDVVVETLPDNVVVDEPEISDSAADNFVQQIPVRTGLGWQQLGALLMLILTVIGVIIYLFEVRPRRS